MAEVTERVVLGVRLYLARRILIAIREATHRFTLVIAIEIDEDGAPVELLCLLHVVGILNRLPEHPGSGLEITEVINDVLGQAQAIVHIKNVEAARASPIALYLAHPQRSAFGLGDVASAEATTLTIGVNVVLANRLTGLGAVCIEVSNEGPRVSLVHRGDHGISLSAVLGQPIGKNLNHLVLSLGANVGALLAGGAGWPTIGPELCRPIIGVRLVERIDGLEVHAVCIFEVLNHGHHVIGEGLHVLGCQLLARGVVDAAGDKAALSEEVGRGV